MKQQSLIDKPTKLVELINKYLKPNELNKKQYGEVFTPMELINEMLDKLNICYYNKYKKSIFENKNLKWYDPCNGMGNFTIILYFKLMKGLENEIIGANNRKKHILEKMIYVSEINKKNCEMIKKIFDANNEYKMNIYNGNSLTYNANIYFKINGFDVIIGNPPYNTSGTRSSGNTVWQDFVKKMINELLLDNGYLCFVHPSGWRKPNTSNGKFYGLYDLLVKNNALLYLEMHNVKDGLNTFDCGTRYDWYVMKKSIDNVKTIIRDEYGKKQLLDIKKYNWLANSNFNTIDKLLAKKNEPLCEIMYSRSAYGADKNWISFKKTKKFKYPVVHSTPKTGIRYVWSNRNDNGFYNISKIIFGESGIYNALIDLNGDYAMSHGAMAIKINNIKEGELLKKVLESEEFKKIIDACSWSSFRIDWNMFSYFKKDFYKEFLKNI